MGIREKLSNSNIGIAVGAGLVILAAFYIWYSMAPAGPTQHTYSAFYSDDDGKSYYSDSIYKFPPIDGKTTLGAMVFSNGKRNFVGCLWRYKPDAKRKLEQAYASDPKSTMTLLGTPAIAFSGTEMKLPGAGSPWLPGTGLRGFMVKDPDGGDLVYPIAP